MAARLGERMPGVDFTGALNRLPGAEGIAPLAEQLEARLNANGAAVDLGRMMETFGNTELGTNGTNLFALLQSLLSDLGINLGNLDGAQNQTSRAMNSAPSGTTPSGPSPNPENVDIPKLSAPISPEDRQMLQERARDADVDNLTTEAKNIAIATLKAFPNLTITSGYRGAERNAAAGGAVGSDHLTGNALDFGTTDPAIKQWIENAFPGQIWANIHGSGGRGPANHTHISYRPGGNRLA